MTVTLFAIAGALVIDDAGRELASLAKQALKRADVSQDFAARATGIPFNKLSLQLSGQVPFTGLWRLLAAPEMRQTDFRVEFVDLLAETIDRQLVRCDLNRLITQVYALVESKPVMAKAQLPVNRQKAEAV